MAVRLHRVPAMLSGKEDVRILALAATACLLAGCEAAAAKRVAPPVFDPPSGTYSSDPWVTITCDTPGATVFYTTDGTVPTTASPAYAGPLRVSSSGTVRAIASAPGLPPSLVAAAEYVVEPPAAATPTFDPPPGDHHGVTVGITTSSVGATIFYTTDGTEPTTSSLVFTEPIRIPDDSEEVTIRAMAAGGGWAHSPVASAAYWTSKLLLRVTFKEPGCIAHGTAIEGVELGVTRAAPKSCPLSTGTITCGVNEACVTDVACGEGVVGILSETSRTNYLIDPTSHPKQAEATQVMPVGPAVAVHAGAGRMTIAPGTASVSGLHCSSVAEGTVCSWTVDAPGTMLVTTTSGTVQAQVESGYFRTSRMDGESRPGDQLRVTNPLADPGRWCVSVSETPAFGRPWGTPGVPSARFALGTWGMADSAAAYEDGASLRLASFDARGIVKSHDAYAPMTAGSSHTIATAYAHGVVTVSVDGAWKTSTEGGTGEALSSLPATLYLGGAGVDGRQAGACIGAVEVWRGLCR